MTEPIIFQGTRTKDGWRSRRLPNGVDLFIAPDGTEYCVAHPNAAPDAVVKGGTFGDTFLKRYAVTGAAKKARKQVKEQAQLEKEQVERKRAKKVRRKL